MKCLVLFMSERRTKHRGAQERRTSSRIRVSVVRLFREVSATIWKQAWLYVPKRRGKRVMEGLGPR
jgi:hypothetical protein